MALSRNVATRIVSHLRCRARLSTPTIRTTTTPWLASSSRRGTTCRIPSPHTRLGFARRPCDSWFARDILTLPPEIRPRIGETLDLILRERIFLLQARPGYRVNVDSHVLALFAVQQLRAITGTCISLPRVLDLGAGTGLVGILFSRACPPSKLSLIELQHVLADRAFRNLALNDLSHVGVVHRFDVAKGMLPNSLHSSSDVVLLNPPFYQAGTRVTSPVQERKLAHIESSARLVDFLRAARLALDVRNASAFVALVQDISELSRVYTAISESGLVIGVMREMRHLEEDEPTRVFFCLHAKKPDGQSIDRKPPGMLRPFVLHSDTTSQLRYTEELERFFAELPTPKLRIGRVRIMAGGLSS